MCIILINIKVMFIHAGVFVLIISLLLIYLPQSTNARKPHVKKPASQFNLNHRAGGNLISNYSKDINLLLSSISITGQVETLYQITLRIETCFLIRSQSPSK